MQMHMMTATSISALVYIATGAVNADVLNVPTVEYPTIQSAINAAINGDTVLVAPGTYNEAIDFLGKEITVESEEGSGSTRIDGTDIESSLVTCTSKETPNSVFRGFELWRGQHGTEDLDPPTFLGGGLLLLSSSPTIEDVLFTECSSALGGGLYALRSDSVLTDCVFYRCIGLDKAGAALIFYNSVTFNNCEFIENWCNGFGGAIHAIHGDHGFYNCTFTLNGGPYWDIDTTWCNYGGALSWYTWKDGPRMTIAGCTLENNRATEEGGGLWVKPTFNSVDVFDTTICFNSDYNIYGRITDLGGNTLCDCFADFNKDGIVNGADLAILSGFWGICNKEDCAPDLNFDGVINGADLALLLGVWGPCPEYTP